MRIAAAFLAAAMLTTVPVSAADGLYISAEFDNDAIDYGINKFTVFGENNTGESKTFRIINTVSENGKLIETADGGSVTVAPGSSFNSSGFVTVPESADIGNTKVDIYLWDGESGTRPASQEISSKSVKFKYNLAEDSRTSAAVYDQSGKLIKTLWSDEQGYAGDNYGVWDGTDDANTPMPEGKYEVKVLSHNVMYTRDSSIGNNTTGTKTSEMISSYNTISDMCLLGNKMYIAEQYMEGGLTCAYFDISKPRQIAGSLEGRNTRINVRNATDGNYVYWMTVQTTPFTETDADGNETVKKVNEAFIYAVDPDTPYNYLKAQTVSFPSGRLTMDIWNVREQFSAIGIVQYESSESVYSTGAYGYGDLAVQKSGDYLAACYGSRDFIRIMNKTTGAKVKDNTAVSPKALTFDSEGRLWAAFKENNAYVIKRFTIEADGLLTENLAAPASVNFEEAIALALNPDETQMTVSYGGDTNRIVSYNLSDWSEAWSYGSGESYKNDPAVYDNKLLFKQSNGGNGFYTHTFLEYEDENHIWIGDPGNYRSFKLNISGTAVTVADEIYSPKQSYTMSADANNAKRVFLGDHEYEIDYSAGGGSGCWRLKNNWCYEAEKLISNTSAFMNSVTTLSNGRTYFMGIDKSDNKYKVFELEEKSIRNTGITVDGYILADGSFTMNKAVKEKFGGEVGKALYRREVTGFDSLNNPVFGTAQRIAFVPMALGSLVGDRTEVTESGYLIGLNNSKDNLRSETNPLDMRLFAYDINSTNDEYKWQAAPSTFRNYKYNFARNGSFEIGSGTWNTVHHQPQIFGNNIIFAHTGEGYKQSQTEIFYHFTEDGLLVGVYGIAPLEQAEYEDYGQDVVNGNGFNWNMVYPEGGDGDTAYIYQAGEARYSGLMRFRVTGLNSIKTQSIGISLGNNLRNGVTAEVFTGNEYLNTGVIAKTAKDNVKLLNGGEGLSEYGIRYTGYLTKPADSEELVKVWINSDGYASLKIENVLRAEGEGLIGTAVRMEDGKSYKLELTVKNAGKDISSIAMFYESDGEIKEYPMINLITENIRNESVRKTVDLLENLPQDAEITENSYGWNFGDMIANAPSSSVKTNYTKYDYRDNSDLYLDIKLKRNETTEVRRSLGEAMDNINEWEIDSEIMLLGRLNGWYTGNIDGQESRYIDILDENDKILARVEAKSDYGVYGNNSLIYQTPTPIGYTEISLNYLHDLAVFNPLKIRCVDGYITFEYKNGAVSTPIYDETANWEKPAAIRISASKQSYIDPYADAYTTVFGHLTFTQSAAADTYLVTFYDDDRTTVLKRENVKKGESATAPNVTKTGYILSWSGDFSSVTANMNIYAVYTPDESTYTVSFYDDDGTFITSSETVFGTAAAAPNMSREGYKFLGWYNLDGTEVNLAEIACDTAVYAKYQRTGTYTENFENFTVDYAGKSISGNTFNVSLTDNLYGDNSYNGEKVMSVKEVTGIDGSATKALYVNPYRAAVGEELRFSFGEIRSGKVMVSFDYKIDSYALSTGFNYFGSLIESGTGSMAACMTEIRSFGSQNPFAQWVSGGVIRRVDKVMDSDGKYSSFTDISNDNNWHSMSYEINMEEKTYKLSIDGSEVGTYGFYDTVSYVDSLYFKGLTYSSTQNLGRYYIDNIKVEYLS